jgi:hypothetical protein
MFTHRMGIPISRRKGLYLTGLVVLTPAIVAAAVFFFMKRRNDPARMQEALRAAWDEIRKVLSSSLMQADMDGPRPDFSAKLDGGVTVVAYTVSNRSDHEYKDIVLNGLTLGKVEPREESTLPIKIAALAPGAGGPDDEHGHAGRPVRTP